MSGNMMDDINKYAKIWDSALEKGIFNDAPKPKPANPADEDSFFGADFFGQNRSDEYDIDAPLNEDDTKYWAEVCRMANPNKPTKLNETVAPKEELKKMVDRVAGSHNPIYPSSTGKDKDPQVAQNWGVGGKEHFQLEELKIRLEKLESKLNALESKGDSGKETQTKIDNLKKQIDDLSDSLSGPVWTRD